MVGRVPAPATALTRELELVHGDQRAVVSTDGGRLLAYVVHGVPVVAGEEPPEGQEYRSSLLAPWPNRVAGGRWTWRGRELELAVNEPDRGTALHGLVAHAPFDVVEEEVAAVTVAHDLQPSPGYPFALRVEASYRLTDGGLEAVLLARNTGDEDAPVALGVHPYVDTRGLVDDVLLELPARTLLVGDDAWQETGRVPVEQTDLDFRVPRRVGTADIDACWTDVSRDADGRVRARVLHPDGRAATVWGGPTTRWLVVYDAYTLAGDAHRRSIAVEPNTAPANALRSGTDLDVLAPGDELELTWGLEPSWVG